MWKNWIKRGIIASNSLRVAARLRRKGIAILMYHSVMDEPEKEKNTLGGIIHSTKVFRSQMELVARKYNPLSLDKALSFVRGEKEPPARSVVITFDDGYADNYERAATVLEEIGIPAAFYVAVDCIENAKLPWPSRLRFAFYTSRQPSWAEPQGTIWALHDMPSRDRAFLKACDDCCTLAGQKQEVFVTRIEHELEADVSPRSKHLMMTWEQVRALTSKGHTVGSHTMTHPNMAYLEEDDLYREFAESKRKLEERLSSPVVHFSYPCPALSPHWAERTVQISGEVGYQTAVTTTLGLAMRGDNPLCLKRVLPTKEVQGLHWNLETTFAGRMA